VRLNHWLRSLFAVPPRRRTRTAAAAVEALEDRTLLTTFTVNTTAAIGETRHTEHSNREKLISHRVESYFQTTPADQQ
jgi:hypothetical protein